MIPRSDRRWLGVGLGLAALGALAAWADHATAWITPAFDTCAHLFYEQPVLAALRRPSQLLLVRSHLAVLWMLVAGGCGMSPWLTPHARRWWMILCVAYAIRATIWIAGGNLPLVPGDSCHYIEIATSVYRGEGPVKHYVESFFRDYPAIRVNRGTLDDWATPLFGYTLAAAYRITGVVPGENLQATVAVAKGTSFLLNLLCLPALYGFARRHFGQGVGLWAIAFLAVLPVHVIYAGFGLRESMVALTSILAIWTLTNTWYAASTGRRLAWAIVAGLCGGLAILARNTALALLAAVCMHTVAILGRRSLGLLLAWAVALTLVIAPWGWTTYAEYGEPFYTYTKFFQYNFSWTVHHYDRGIIRAGDFYTWANAPEIVRVKLKSLAIILIYSIMIPSVPLVLGFASRFIRAPRHRGYQVDRLAALLWITFVAATLANIADVTQVAQLARYYLPVFVLCLPTATAGLRDWLERIVAPRGWKWIMATTIACLWADPTWTYDATWLVKPYQLHWPALRDAGEWVRAHPNEVPTDARILTWFPWEFRLASQRATVLFPRSLEGGAYELKRIQETIRQYNVTHVLWGSFEPAAHADPESLGPYLTNLRAAVGLRDDLELYRSAPQKPYPVRLYRVAGGPP